MAHITAKTDRNIPTTKETRSPPAVPPEFGGGSISFLRIEREPLLRRNPKKAPGSRQRANRPGSGPAPRRTWPPWWSCWW